MKPLFLLLNIFIFSAGLGAMDAPIAVVPAPAGAGINLMQRIYQPLAASWGSLKNKAYIGLNSVKTTLGKIREIITAIPGGLTATKEAVDKIHQLPVDVERETGKIMNTAKVKVDETIDHLSSSISGVLLKTGGITIGVITTFFVSRIIWSSVQESLRNPRLVRKTSRKNWFQRLNLRKTKPEEQIELIFAPDLLDELQRLIVATKWITHRIQQGDKVHYRSLFLYGPPGTGKTKFAEKLSFESGLDYALMSGADILSATPGQLNELFEWALQSQRGVVLFIDEADALLASRNTSNVDSPHYQQLSRFLNYTSSHSNKFMLVFATNHPQIIDPAIGRRVEDQVEFKLPEYHERIDILELYAKKLLFDEAITSKEFSESARRVLDPKKLASIAKNTAGLSGAELESIINVIKTDSEIAPEGIVKEWIVDKAVRQTILKHQKFNTSFKIPAAMSLDPESEALMRSAIST